MVTHNIYYATSITLMLILFFSSIFTTGCTIKYTYSNIDTSNFLQTEQTTPPSLNSAILSQDTLLNLDYVSFEKDIITISNPNITNYILENLNNYVFIFSTDAIVTINYNFHSVYKSAIVSTAENLYINLNGNISTSIMDINIAKNLSTNCAIKANNLHIFGNGTVSCETGSCIEAQNTNLFAENLELQCVDTAWIVMSTICNICCKNLKIVSNNGFYCEEITFTGGKSDLLTTSQAISTQNIYIKNGIINIDAELAINCKNLIKDNGFLTIFANIGAISSSTNIKNGYFYAKCKTLCIKASNNLLITGGTTLLVSTKNNYSSIDAETATFNINGGTLISNSSYACMPKDNALVFDVTANSLFVLTNGNNQLVYIPEVSGSLMVAGQVDYNYFSTNGKVIDFSQNFYGLLLNANVNTYSSRYISTNYYNFGGEVYNGTYTQSGQLF